MQKIVKIKIEHYSIVTILMLNNGFKLTEGSGQEKCFFNIVQQ